MGYRARALDSSARQQRNLMETHAKFSGFAPRSQSVPKDPALDGTFGMLTEGYNYIWNRCQRFQSHIFSTRILGKKAVCIHGREAAALFYDESKLQRAGAIPRRVIESLFGQHAVHTLDDAPHRRRKAAFLSLMEETSMSYLMNIFAREWRLAIRRWEAAHTVVLFDEVQRLLTRSVCEWAGVPLDERDVTRRARDLIAMVDAFGAAGPRLWKGKAARRRTERWITGLIEAAREGRLDREPGCALFELARHADEEGRLLPARNAAIELINVLRPTVALTWYITFAALALRTQAHAREKIAREPIGEGVGEYTELFMQEVRRFYPFTPYLAAKVRAPFEWRGHHFERGTLVLLDVYGNNHDPALWDNPEDFRPERFKLWRSDPFSFIPQGGGDPRHGHRCPGEWITMHGVALALHFLTRCMTFHVPKQDLSFSLRRMPTRPKSGFVIRDVVATETLDGPVPRLPSATAARDAALLRAS
jgi:fatty-acid peroxygenase